MSGKLFVVGTPIGNLGDISPRALDTLQSVDFIAAEDTRVTLKLLNHFGIKKPHISYFEHNRREKGELIVNRILCGENCAIVTDAGMPAVSDPGEDLVALCHESGVTVNVVPGPSAFVAAIALSGMEVGRFTFEGFLSMNKVSRKEHLEEIKTEKTQEELDDFVENLTKPKYAIRKLTPKECFRLMNFSDEDFEKAKAVNSNSQLYKQAGNSIVRAVLIAIFSQLGIQGHKKWNEMTVEERRALVYKGTILEKSQC